MTKRTLGILLAVTAIAVFATIVIASSLGGDDETGMHAMPDGQMMEDSDSRMSGEDQEMGPSGQMNGDGEHMMEDGQMMDDSDSAMRKGATGDDGDGDGESGK
jgi:hypothetical protein